MKINKNIIPRIEKALNFKLKDWQIAYILEEPIALRHDMFERRGGKTTAYIITHALTGAGRSIAYNQLENVSDEIEPISYRRGFFPNFYLDIVNKLNAEGIQTVKVIKSIW